MHCFCKESRSLKLFIWKLSLFTTFSNVQIEGIAWVPIYHFQKQQWQTMETFLIIFFKCLLSVLLFKSSAFATHYTLCKKYVKYFVWLFSFLTAARLHYWQPIDCTEKVRAFRTLIFLCKKISKFNFENDSFYISCYKMTKKTLGGMEHISGTFPSPYKGLWNCFFLGVLMFSS